MRVSELEERIRVVGPSGEGFVEERDGLLRLPSHHKHAAGHVPRVRISWIQGRRCVEAMVPSLQVTGMVGALACAETVNS